MSVSSKTPNPGKGARYLGQLDQALCNGNWTEIAELARKTDKHAPERKCFTLVARSEAQIAAASHRPTSASSATVSSIQGLGSLVPQLAKVIEEEKKFLEDSHVARVCLAEIHWLREDFEAALGALSAAGQTPGGRGSSHVTALGWIEVSEVKASFIKAVSLQSTGKEAEARQLYLRAAEQTPGSRTPELRRWTERLLGRACLFTKTRASSPTLKSLSESLKCFLAWSDFWQRAPSPAGSNITGIGRLDLPRRQVWKDYYDLLSTILQYGLMYNPSPASPSDLLTVPSEDTPDDQYTTMKIRQRAALNRVEATYESLLLNETQFPKASQTNTEVEEWVEQVVLNWRTFCGSEWTDSELGESGKETVGHGVLDILYRAATKTFHSTSILRQLFTVHAALGEFELAMHAFNSYVELVSKAKARAEKTDKHEIGFDSEDTAILAAAEAVRILCRNGDREQAEKAVEVGNTIKKWLRLDDYQDVEQQNPGHSNGVQIKPKTLATAHRAIGISQAHWARLAYETDERPAIQAKALQELQQAHEYDPDGIDTAYALAAILAETREVSGAAEIIRRTIMSPGPADEEDADEDSNDYYRERKLVSLWHLLALCLTAKDDVEQAAKMCEAAFEQFGDPIVLFGDSNNRLSTETDKSTPRSSKGLVDQMEGFERAGILQVKMTQLALIELMEGAETAVDVSHELLGLYSRLFGNPELMKPASKPPPTATSTTHSKVGGTLRSLAGSIRPKSAMNSVEKDIHKQGSVKLTHALGAKSGLDGKDAATNGQNIGVPIAITVTNEDGVSAEKPHSQRNLPFKLRGQQGDWRELGNLKPNRSYERISAQLAMHTEEMVLPSSAATVDNTDFALNAHRAGPVQAAVQQSASPEESSSPEQPLKHMEHNAPHDTWPPPSGHQDQPPRQDLRLPAPHPASSAFLEPRFPSAQDRQHKISLLVNVWLFIAGMYLRAGLFDDAAGAAGEATKLIEGLEMEISAEGASARRFFVKDWAGGKSVDELWADAWAAKGDLASARQLPFQALDAFEQALSYAPDHVDGVIGLSNILMDMYEEKIPIEEPRPLLQNAPSASGDGLSTIPPPPPRPNVARQSPSTPAQADTSAPKTARQEPSPTALNRLAARDRAYMLLSNLTHLGNGWDNPQVWYTLARAHELSKQIGKAKQALWWVVELENNNPVRPWSDVSAGGFTI